MKPLGSPERVRSGERKPVIDNVSDTARWVAEYRARESARRDRLFSDPYAAALAGERGRVIAEEARRGFGNGWFFIARTKLIDLLVEECVAEGCTRVINLAAGFDTRPYRLDLPSSLEWVEADLPGIIEEKERALAAEKPRCVLSRTAVDLTDADARRAFLASATAGGGRTLVITEGLLLYLDASEVHALSADLKSCRVTWWTADVIGPLIRRLSARASRENNAPVVFAPDDGVAFFERAGWAVERVGTQLSAAAKWRRLSPLMRLVSRLPQADPRHPGNSLWSAVVRLRDPDSAGRSDRRPA
ncbi:class I SAM-dependent methyltransferase [Streptomyces mobaraensis NBRC 13819 = DSM 40847]|uniref:S-adenosyl-L-methionine-dependent methyltransferase n=1 Tax=Streptomyces mobaraensis (strain ATCC 29032 / DSM 40847 / JCM 4168 / NBRC 13819 / NCIMB 11159 / IPCR 16-22) TaxID=1223523 RepID=M3A3C1_STRM1|nr:SAM-dependent methyltransferase [Streptomyces mobaraensis]EME99548.1 O-methyltransferase [Streptomyces mobaraensis NBRC 13819 = DSM 40847]QTT73077.1 class I SAM-dependent methyltransferase [Streptomyces mobaraensis NBRC 13819 = DSM 40847]